jgi:hypothetical protein
VFLVLSFKYVQLLTMHNSASCSVRPRDRLCSLNISSVYPLGPKDGGGTIHQNVGNTALCHTAQEPIQTVQ